MSDGTKYTQGWRDVLPVHPAADLFPLMSREELIALANDIKKNGLLVPVVVMHTERGGLPTFLLRRRVELNALTSDQLVIFVERKLIEHGVAKLVPDAGILGDAYQLFVKSRRAEEIIRRTLEDIDEQEVQPPPDLGKRVAERLRQDLKIRWDQAVASIAREDNEPPNQDAP